jgi:hypothetical protein
MSREALVVGINFYKKITGFNSLNIPSEMRQRLPEFWQRRGTSR